jgi:uncharacterized protein YbaP (TraB family)
MTGPPLYVAERGSAKVYILGVTGSPNRDWMTPRIRVALAESKEFWREVPTAELNPEAIAYSDKLGTRENGSLFDDLTPELGVRVTAAAKKFDLPIEKLKPMKPWYAARVLGLVSWSKMGRAPGAADNPEIALSEVAKASNIPVKSEISDWNAFADFFDRMSLRAQVQYIAYSLDFIDKGDTSEEAPERAWVQGDVSYYEKNVQDFSARYPDLYDALNGQRDAEWTERIDGFLKAGGTTFILVGINHTVGPGSIQVYLRKAGIHVRRV